MNIKFYNTNLGFQLYPFTGKDQNGRSQYDTKNGQQTTVSYEGAYSLYHMCSEIVQGKVSEGILSVPCVGATITLERKLGLNGPETVFSLTKNNVTIPFKFATGTMQVKENGQVITKQIESGVGNFMEVIFGYLTGVNSDRHLDKMTDDYAKLNNAEGNNNAQQQPQANNNQRPQYNNNGNYRPRNGNGYNNNYRGNNNRNNGGPNNQNWGNGRQTFQDYNMN